jgi:hypothetical protein
MANTLVLDPNAIYDEGAISLALDISLSTLDRARRLGQLRYARKGHRIFFRGQWLLDWFDADPTWSGVKVHCSVLTSGLAQEPASLRQRTPESPICREGQQ